MYLVYFLLDVVRCKTKTDLKLRNLLLLFPRGQRRQSGTRFLLKDSGMVIPETIRPRQICPVLILIRYPQSGRLLHGVMTGMLMNPGSTVSKQKDSTQKYRPVDTEVICRGYLIKWIIFSHLVLLLFILIH